jgi:AcrR family transcriptional regulator
MDAHPGTRPRRGGRPTRAQAARLDLAVRDAALRLFLAHGYEGTSMDAVARSAGTTKASLYARFPSKDELFRAVLDWAVQRGDWPIPQPPAPDLDDPEQALTAIARSALQRARHPAIITLERLATAHAARCPDVAHRLYRTGFGPAEHLVAELLRRHVATGAIVADDPEVLAGHFLAMVSSGRWAAGGGPDNPAESDRHVHGVVRLFLRGVRADAPPIESGTPGSSADRRTGTDSAAAQPAARSAPDLVEPDLAEPDLVEPDLAEPDLAEPETADPSAPSRPLPAGHGPAPGPRRRSSTGESSTREQLLNATAQVMLTEGFAAATSRRVAAAAGVKPALVHYYFPTMDDLLVSVFRRGAQRHLERQRAAIADRQPLRTLWESYTGTRDTALILEFMAMAAHRPAIRTELADYTVRSRELQQAAVTQLLDTGGPIPGAASPMVTNFLLGSVSLMLVWERALGITAGHGEVIEYVENFLHRLEAAGSGRDRARTP